MAHWALRAHNHVATDRLASMYVPLVLSKARDGRELAVAGQTGPLAIRIVIWGSTLMQFFCYTFFLGNSLQEKLKQLLPLSVVILP